MPESIKDRLRLVGLTVCILMLTACGAAKPPSGVKLDVPFLAQETLLCVPTSAAMVLAFYGDAQPPRKLKALAAGRAYDPAAPFTDFSHTVLQPDQRSSHPGLRLAR